jgi:phosphohistidine phosphatase
MDVLILMRHAKAVADHEAPDDRSRVLAGKGKIDAPAAGAALAAQDLRPDRALVSTAARTRETWSFVAPLLGGPPTEFREALYMAGPEDIWRQAIGAGAPRVMIVGHNPGLHDVARLLIDQANDKSALARAVSSGMPPAAWAAFSVTGSRLHAAGATLIGGWSPKAT